MSNPQIAHRCADCGSGYAGTECWNCLPIVADVPFTIDFSLMAEYDAMHATV